MDVYAWLLLPLGFVSGTVNALLGLGWGVVNIPILMLIPGFTIRKAVALSVVTAIFMSAAATFENARHGLIQWNYVLLMGVGALCGGVLGSWLLRNVPLLTLQRMVGALVIVLGAKLLFAR